MAGQHGAEGSTVAFPPLPEGVYDVIYADPPWDYDGQSQHTTGGKSTGGATTHYDTVTLDDLKALNIRSVAAKNAVLFMWVTGPQLERSFGLLRAWGFRYATVAFVWYKKRTNPGAYTLSECEFCLVGKRGSIPKPRGSRKERQFVAELRGTHSRKPREVRKRIERMFPEQTKLELFARGHADGWTGYGHEAAKTTSVWSDDHEG